MYTFHAVVAVIQLILTFSFPLGFGFVTFDEPAFAETAVKAHFVVIHDKRVSFSS